MSTRSRRAEACLGVLVLVLTPACSHAPARRDPTPAGSSLALAPAGDAQASSEALRAGLEAALSGLASSLAAHDAEAARRGLARDFRGTWLAHAASGEVQPLPLDTLRRRETVAGAPALEAAGFVEAWQARFADWRELASLDWSLEGALFEPDGERVVATGTLRIDVVGRGSAGAWTGLEAQATFSALLSGGAWRLSRLELTELSTIQRAERLFVDIAGPTGLADAARDATALAAGDVDRDGLWDLFVAGRGGNRLYLARRDGGAFVEEAAQRGVDAPGGAQAAVFFDVEGDTDQDLLLATPERVRLFLNGKRGVFEERSADFGLDVARSVAAAAVFDWDLDGRPDVFLGCVEPPGQILLRNVEGRAFEDVTQAAGLSGARACSSVALGDFDYDGLVDLYVVDPDGPNRLYHRERDQSNAPGVYVDLAASRVVGDDPGARGALFADVDQDGQLDLYVVHGPPATASTLFLGRGLGWFTRGSAASGGLGPRGRWAPAVADFDLDGRVDLCVTGEGQHAGFWLGGAEDTFADLSLVSGLESTGRGLGAAALDVDDDGDVDLFVPSAGGGPSALFRNDIEPEQGFVKVQLMATRSWYEAVGAVVTVDGPQGKQAQTLTRGSGYGGCPPPELVFGLGDKKRARIEVRWPGGIGESFGWVEAGTRVLLVQTIGRADVLAPLTLELRGPAPAGARDGR